MHNCFVVFKRKIFNKIKSYFSRSLPTKKIMDKYISFLYRKNNGASTYSIISACYNVDKYIDDFIESIIHQTLDFKKNIQLILVDDGSIDKTWIKIQEWKKKYPMNIIGVSKLHEGVASARNFGMKYAKHDWFCFADPDDFFDCYAFEKVDEIASYALTQDIGFISLNLLYYFEDKNKFSDTHPLRYKYYYPVTVRKIKYLNDYIQIVTNSICIRKDLVKDIRFSNLIKPCSEDVFFINSLFLKNEDKKICFLKDAKYFYRKRKNHSSLIDNCWKVQEFYDDCLRYGNLKLLELATNNGNRRPPTYVQNCVIYSNFWYFVNLKNNDELLTNFGTEIQQNFLNLLLLTFQKIEPSLIKQFPGKGFNKELCTAIAFFTKETADMDRVINITKYDSYTSEIKCQFLIKNREEIFHFYLDEKEIFPVASKIVSNKFCGRDFSLLRICWLPLVSSQDGIFRVTIGNKAGVVALKGSEKSIVRVSDIVNNFELDKRNLLPPSRFNNCWLISDRVSHADDNGEHFYRFLIQHAPYVNAWFILSKKSTDWIRLKKEGFKLIDYGSADHKTALQYCTQIISSHIERDQLAAFGDRVDKRVPFVFLQHGITKDDISEYFNKADIRFLITSTQDEKNSITDDKSRYLLTSREVLLTGFPRHDGLLKNSTSKRKVVLVAPTWRSSIAYRPNNCSKEKVFQKFFQTEYAKAWNSLINNPYLLELLQNYGYAIKFFPHPKIQPFLQGFYFQNNVIPCTYDSCRVQDLLCEASLLITDYSSIAFDFAYLEKEVIYYQFDEEKIFQGRSHTYKKGYYDYYRDGFGPIAHNEGELIQLLDGVLTKDCKVDPIYLDRMKKTFPVKDGKNCERIFDAIYRRM